MNITKLIALCLVLISLVSCFAACSDNNGGESLDSAESTQSGVQSEDTSEEQAKSVSASDIADFTPYVSLGQYKGVEISLSVISDEYIQNELYLLMDSLKTYEDIGTTRPAKLTDVVIIDYTGYYADTNEAFDGGAAEDYSLELGSNTFIAGFEDAIVGHSAGEEFDITVTFPEDYREESLKGKDARFAIKLKTVKELSYPELTDEVAKSLSFETAEKLKEQAELNAEETVYTENLQKAWEEVLANATIKDYPEELFNYTKESFVDYYVSQYRYMAAMYGMELEDYVGMPEEQFIADVETQGVKYAEGYLNEEMVVFAIADEEFGRDISEEEYNEKLQEYADQKGVTVDEFKESYDETAIKNNIIWDKALIFVYENAVKTEATEVESSDSEG